MKNVHLSKKRLSIPELNKEKRRWNIFLSKLNHNSPFLIENIGEAIIQNSKEIVSKITNNTGELDLNKVNHFFKPENRYAPIFHTKKGKFKLNQFHKTPEFGGGSGISLGTINARKYETIQANFFSLRQTLGRDLVEEDLKYIINENYYELRKEFLHNVKSKRPLSSCDIKYFQNNGWVYTYIKIANEFYKTLNKNKHYTFYHAFDGTGIADEIYRVFVRCFDNINTVNKIKISMSRWNPSDIWAVESDLENEIIKSLKNINKLSELNIIIDTLFDNKFLVGISLKKIPIEKEIELIVNKTLHTNFIYDKTTTSINPFDTLTVQLHSKSYSWLGNKRKEILDARIYTGKEESNMFLEIRGSVSKYGKASLTYINSILERVDIEPIPKYKDITLSNQELRDKIIWYYKHIPKLRKVLTICRNNIHDTRSKLISKYQALMFVYKIEKNKNKPYKKGLFNFIKFFIFKKKRSISNYIIKEIFYYAYSMGGELFDNVKFYRIKISN